MRLENLRFMPEAAYYPQKKALENYGKKGRVSRGKTGTQGNSLIVSFDPDDAISSGDTSQRAKY